MEISQGGRGGHLWIFFDHPVSAWLVRAFWRGLIQYLKLPMPEIFPRQDTLAGKTVGNPIRYPLYNQSHFVDPAAGWKGVAPAKALAGVVRTTVKKLTIVARKLGFQLKRAAASNLHATVAGDTGDAPYRVKQLLLAEPHGLFARRWNGDTSGLQDRSRSALAYAIACLLVWSFVPTDDVLAAVRCWCQLNRYEKSNREDWLNLTVTNAYESAFQSALTRRRTRTSIENLCDPSGPIVREFRNRINKQT